MKNQKLNGLGRFVLLLVLPVMFQNCSGFDSSELGDDELSDSLFVMASVNLICDESAVGLSESDNGKTYGWMPEANNGQGASCYVDNETEEVQVPSNEKPCYLRDIAENFVAHHGGTYRMTASGYYTNRKVDGIVVGPTQDFEITGKELKRSNTHPFFGTSNYAYDVTYMEHGVRYIGAGFYGCVPDRESNHGIKYDYTCNDGVVHQRRITQPLGACAGRSRD